MSFKLRHHEDHSTGMVAVCDVCGNLALANDAMIAWTRKTADEPGDLHEFAICCKDKCLDRYEREHGFALTQELGPALIYLLHNTKTPKLAVEQAAALASVR